MKPYLLGISAALILSALFHGLGLTDILPWHVVYSDLLGFYERVAAPGFPYISKLMEYPVITGLFIQLMGAVSGTKAGYFIVSVITLGLVAIASTALLYKLLPENQRSRLWMFWIAAPSMVIFSVFNWDFLAVFFVIAAIYFERRDKDLWASAMLALGFASKFYPALLLIPLLIKNTDLKRCAKIIAIFSVVALAVNLPFMIMNWDGWSYFFTMNSARDSNPDSIWTIFRFLFRGLDAGKINALSLISFAALYAYLMRKFRRYGFIKLSFLATIAFVLTNKIFSPQYLLWLLPYYVLLSIRPNRFWFYVSEFGNAGALFSILPWFFLSNDIFYFFLASPFVILRHTALIALLIGECNRLPVIENRYKPVLSNNSRKPSFRT